jgi:hypothetical protein
MSTLIPLPKHRHKDKFRWTLGNFAWSFRKDKREHVRMANKEYIRIFSGLWYCYLNLDQTSTTTSKVIPFPGL